MNKIIDDLNWRYAVKRFDPMRKISDQDLETLKESLRLTPTSYGLQAYKVLLIESPEIREQLVEASYGQRQVAEASHLFVLCAYNTIQPEDVEAYMQLISEIRDVPVESLEKFGEGILKMVKNRSGEDIRNWTAKQTYIALGQLMHTCASLRIDSVPMEGFNAKAYDSVLGLSERNLTATLVCPVGYRHEEDTNQFRNKVRKAPDDLFETI